MDKFKTIKNNETAEIEEKRSKFIANIFYVENMEEVEKIIKQTKKKYYDARHNCYAYIVKEENNVLKRFSDDGEPSGTAGSPILNVIEKNNLCNVLIIVTRYFGGILLGAGGLVRAYTESATKAVEKANVTEKQLGYEIEIELSYQDLPKLKYYCEKKQINILNINYETHVMCRMEVSKEEKDILLNQENYNKKAFNILKNNIIKEKFIDK